MWKRSHSDNCCDSGCSGGENHTMIALVTGVQMGKVTQLLWLWVFRWGRSHNGCCGYGCSVGKIAQ